MISIAYCGWDHPLVGCPGVYKKAGWESHGEQVSKQSLFVASALVLASRFLAYLDPYPDFQW